MNGLNFKRSAEILRESLETGEDGISQKSLISIPMYYLISHAAELFLKASLLKRGYKERERKNFKCRHHLKELLAKLLEKNVPVTKNTIFLIEGLSNQHKEHDLRYNVLIDNGKSTFLPPIDATFKMLDELFSLTRISTHGI